MQTLRGTNDGRVTHLFTTSETDYRLQRRNFGIDRSSPRNWAIYSMTAWSLTNSAALTVRYWPRSPILLGHGSLIALSILVPLSLLSLLAGFVLAFFAVLEERRSIRSWLTLALASAVLGQLIYLVVATPLY
jgi:hypothetical protein